MEPVSIIGLAGSVVGIVDVITRSLVALKELQSQWQVADWTIAAVIGHLSTLKAALNQIREWISTDLAAEPQHFQLVLDLGDALDSCKALILFIDGQLSRLEWDGNNKLTLQSRVKAVFNDGGVKDCVNHLNNQSNALNLLLTALNCRSIPRQKSLLEAKASRRLLDQVKDDSSSLIGLRDADSFISLSTKSTGRSSLLSRIFAFDAELTESKVYQKQQRFLMVKAVRKPKRARRFNEMELREYTQRSEEIDNRLEDDKMNQNREIQILVQGSNPGRLALMVRLQTVYGNTRNESGHSRFHESLRTRLVNSMLSLVQSDKSLLELPECAGYIDTIRKARPGMLWYPGLDSMISDAIRGLWKQPAIKQRYQQLGNTLWDEANGWLLDSFACIPFCPTERDVIISKIPQCGGVPETSVVVGEYICRFIYPDIPKVPKKFGLFQNIDYPIIIAEVASKAKPRLRSGKPECLEESLKTFAMLMDSQGCRRGGVMLILSGTDVFRKELETVPLAHHFSDFQGSNNYPEACDYILKQFTARNRDPRKEIYAHFVDSTIERDYSVVEFVIAAIRDMVLQENIIRIFGEP